MNNVAIFGGSKLGKRAWHPGKKTRSIAVFGGSEIDFRQAKLEEEVTKVITFSLFRGNKIIVPEDMPVTLSGISILGSKEVKRSHAKEAPPASAKALFVNTTSILGSCTVTEKPWYLSSDDYSLSLVYSLASSFSGLVKISSTIPYSTAPSGLR